MFVPFDAPLPVDDDPGQWSVLRDWLEERGDLRAELIRRFERRDEFEAFVAAKAEALMGGAGRVPHPQRHTDGA
jgi:hypothetical protein